MSITLAALGLALVTACQTTSASESKPMVADKSAAADPSLVQVLQPGDDLPAHIDPNEIRGGIPAGGRDGKSREELTFERIIRNVEPDLKGDPDRLNSYIANFASSCVSDTRLFAFNVKPEMKGDTLVLTGYAEFEQNRDALEKYFKYLKFENIDNQVETLPTAELGDKLFGLVLVSSEHIYAAPDPRSEKLTTDFVGDVVHLLKPSTDGYYLCHSSEGYAGYIPGASLWLATAAEVSKYKNGPQAMFRRAFEKDSVFIPAGAVLTANSSTDKEVEVVLPTGEMLAVPADAVRVRDANEIPEATKQAIESARQLLGTRYLWGGKDPEGVDCSGLVQVSFKSQGIVLARDASQQVLAGRLTGTRWHMDEMKPGDLVYFVNGIGKVSHTGMYIGNMEYIEATGPVAKITSLAPGAPNYDERRAKTFCFAKRVVE